MDGSTIMAEPGAEASGTRGVIAIDARTKIGGGRLCLVAGPCSIESEEQMLLTALAVKKAGADILRGGAFKPRTSPYDFQGLGVEGLKMLRAAGDAAGLPVVTEVMDTEDLPVVAEYADILQIGARNCQNFSLLRKAGRMGLPILLKRGMMLTIKEFLLAAEYILAEGNPKVILCERGIRTFETETRNTLDISAVPILKAKTKLPVFVDPSHAAGSRELVGPLSLAAVAAGADGLVIECHVNPDIAWCDGKQSLTPGQFAELARSVRGLAAYAGRER